MNHHISIPRVSIILALVTVAAPALCRAQADTARPALSTISAEEMEALLGGSGGGAGKPAEINGYPGPKRLIENALELGLSSDQIAKVKSLNQRMKREAMELGGRIVAGETELDVLLKSGSADRGKLASLVSEIAGLRGRMRLVHLDLHFALRALLTDEQFIRYRALSAGAEAK